MIFLRQLQSVCRSRVYLSCYANIFNVSKHVHRSNVVMIRLIHSTPFVAANKDKPKKKSSTGGKIDLHIADDLFNLQELKTDMQTKVDKLKIEYRQKYPLKLTAECVDNIYVTDSSGSSLPLAEVAQVSVTEKEFIIRPMVESKNILSSLVKGIQNAELNINPTIDGDIIKFIVPASTTEYRNNILKLAKASGEKVKVVLRKLRQKASIELRKKNASVDTIKKIEEMIQLLLDSHINQIDELYAKKAEEVKK